LRKAMSERLHAALSEIGKGGGDNMGGGSGGE
jgi:hypothetical protein